MGIIDLLAEVSDVGAYEEALAQSVLVGAFDREVRALDLQALIHSKRAAGRQNLELLEDLERLLEGIR